MPEVTMKSGRLPYWRILPLFAVALGAAGTATADQPNVLWMRAGSGPVGAIAYTSDGSTLVTQSNNAIRVWRLSDGVLLKNIIVPGQDIGCISLTPDGQYAAVTINPSGASAGPWSISLVRLSDGAILTTINVGPAGTFGGFVLSAEATLLAVAKSSSAEGGANGPLVIYNFASGTAVKIAGDFGRGFDSGPRAG
jgi:WD40 repeat protein